MGKKWIEQKSLFLSVKQTNDEGYIVTGEIYYSNPENNDLLLLKIGGPGTPFADFTWSPSNPTTDDLIEFDASDSYDPNGIILSYDWDFDNDNKFDDASGKNVEWQWTIPDNYVVSLRIIDDDRIAIKTKIVNVTSNGNSRPTVTIRFPKDGSTDYGYVFILGYANDPDGSNTLERVEIDFDNNNAWKEVIGKSMWICLR